MAQQVSVRLVDDLDGSVASETVVFGLDGRAFEIDLSAGNAGKLREVLASFVAAARRGTGGGRRASAGRATRSAGGGGGDSSAIREWARAHDFQVSDRGRIAQSVMQAYTDRDAISASSAAPVGEAVKAVKKPRKRRLTAAS